jgi:arylsulfatase A-like enzyme
MPAAVVWPGVVQPGRTIDTFVSTADIFPTVLAAANINLSADHTIDGKDMGPILRGAPLSNRQYRSWHLEPTLDSLSRCPHSGETNVTQHEVFFHYCGFSIAAARVFGR